MKIYVYSATRNCRLTQITNKKPGDSACMVKTTLDELGKVIENLQNEKHQEKPILISYINMHLETFYSDY
jgi:hypothetical protein